MDTPTLESIRQVLSKNNKIGIVIGKNAGLDEMGAALALYLFLRTGDKQLSIASPSEPTVAVSSLVGIDKVKQNLSSGNGDLVVSFPYTEGEIDKVSYTLESGHLNIIVKASSNGLSFDEQNVKYKRGGGVPSLLFVVGTSKVSDLDDLFDTNTLKDTTIVNIDNKASNQGFGDIVFVSGQYSSVSEQMASLIRFLGGEFSTDVAQNLLSGIASATSNFQDPKTSYTAFEIAAVLMRMGAVRPRMQFTKPQTNVGMSPSSFGVTAHQGGKQPIPQRRDQRTEHKWNEMDQRVQSGRSQFQSRQQGQFGVINQQSQKTPVVEEKEMLQNAPDLQRHEDISGSQSASFSQFQQNLQGPQKTHQQPAKQQGLPEDKDNQEAPPDWLTPKVYKGSTLV